MSKKVKIILIQGISFDEYGEDIIRDGISDWEEVSDEDFEFLKFNLYRLKRQSSHYDYTYHLIVQDSETISFRIDSIKKAIEAEKAKIELAKVERENAKLKRAEAKKLKDQAKLLASEQTEKEVYEKLKEKFEN